MDLQKIRADFPILSREVYGKPLVYFDNGATTQKPRQVVDAITDEYYSVNANVHRGVHFLSQQATELHEASRETVRKFINARSTNEIVFTRGTTESINLLVSSFGDEFMQEVLYAELICISIKKTYSLFCIHKANMVICYSLLHVLFQLFYLGKRNSNSVIP